MGLKDKKLFYEKEFGILNASSDASWGNAENGKSFSGGVVLLVILCLKLILVSRVRPRRGPLSGAQRVNSEFRVGSNFRIMPEQYFSGVENVAEFLGNIDNNLTYYEIPTQLACAYLKGHLTGRALERFEVLGYRVVEDKAMDYAHLKQALTEQFPVVRNRSELYIETRFFVSSQ
ncbi:uncharacterized protein TNCV_1526941 [Trichonephila clavipes]|nr:uncharacterized protein TNCV_1526941 [Trichonephila clavipes]